MAWRDDPAIRAAYIREWRAKRKQEFFDGKSCVDCGATENLQLDHRDPATKVGSDVWVWAAGRRDAEIAKCDIRCESCHRERHARELRRHGPGGYNRGCRCDVCREASRARASARRAALRPSCFFADHVDTDCDGRMERAHLVPKQRIKREFRGTEPELLKRIVWHPGVWVWACRRHHGDFDAHVFRVGRSELPAGVEVFAEALGVGWMLDREFGPLERVA